MKLPTFLGAGTTITLTFWDEKIWATAHNSVQLNDYDDLLKFFRDRVDQVGNGAVMLLAMYLKSGGEIT